MTYPTLVFTLGQQTVKGQIISECPYEIIVYPKIAMKISEISALASKERSNQKNKGTLLY